MHRKYNFFLEMVDTKIYYKFWMRPYNLSKKIKKKVFIYFIVY